MSKKALDRRALGQKIWGHCHLVKKERNIITQRADYQTLPSYIFHYRCDCGRTWTQSAHTRMWHCGSLDCPHLPRRKRQAFKPRPVGRPRTYDKAFGEGDELHSTSTYRRRISFNLSFDERDEFESMCTVLRTTMNHELQEMVRGWITSNTDAANSSVERVNNYNAKFGKSVMTPEQIEEEKEAAIKSEEYRKIYYRDGKTMDELFAVESSHEPMRNGKPIFGDRQGSR